MRSHYRSPSRNIRLYRQSLQFGYAFFCALSVVFHAMHGICANSASLSTPPSALVFDTECMKLDYEFALILHNVPYSNSGNGALDTIKVQQTEILHRCIEAGLEIALLSSTIHSRDFLVFLLRPTQTRLEIENDRLVLERWLQIGAMNRVSSEMEQFIAKSDFGRAHCETRRSKFTPSERIQIIARILFYRNDQNPPGAHITTEDEKDSVIHACFPLHDHRVNTMLLQKSKFCWYYSETLIQDLRFYYGERVAIYFTFVIFYTKCLSIPALFGTALYIFCRFDDALLYKRYLCIFGFAIACVWGSCTLKGWRRQNQIMNDRWNLCLFKEAEYPNASYKAHGNRDILDQNGQFLYKEAYDDPIYRIPAYLQTFAVFAVFIVLYIVSISFFVLWYTAAMIAPVCDECSSCQEILSCFHTRHPTIFSWRWSYIIVQGILLSVSLDIVVYFLSVKLLHYFVTRENHATEAEFQRTMINRLFALNWISFFLWFILIAFVIVPFGKHMERFLTLTMNTDIASVHWENSAVDISTALMTPLLVTQALNLLLDTWIVHVLIERISRCAHRIAQKIRVGSTELRTEIKNRELAIGGIPYIESALGIKIETLEGIQNEKYLTADDLLEESHLAAYDPFTDYLRMVIQFGYVVMFSVVWPFCGIAAFVNNILHVPNCLRKVCLLRRRPIPRKANSIGQWEKMLYITIIIAIFVVVGLICVSSGELEAFFPQCKSKEAQDRAAFSLTPNFGCIHMSKRFIVALALEHAAFLVIYLCFDCISDSPPSVRTSLQRKKETIRRAMCKGKSLVREKSTLDCVLEEGWDVV